MSHQTNAIVHFNGQTIRRTWHNEGLAQGWGQIVTPFSIQTYGSKQKLNCANTESLLRIIQSIPSPKAEPFKRWLAEVGPAKKTIEKMILGEQHE